LTEYNSEFARIRELLEKNPRGLTITEISDHIVVNRNSVAKYLDVMMISGEIEQRPVGRAKIFYPSHRIPIANLLDYSSDLIFVVNEKSIITQANINFYNFFNLKQEEIIGKELSTIFDSKIHSSISELLHGVSGSLPRCIEINDHWFRPKIIPTVFIDGTNGITLIMEDITEEKKTIAALEESDNRFHMFVRAATSGLLLTDSEFRVIEINDAGLNITGLRREQVLGKHILDFPVDTRSSGRFDSYQDISNKKKPFTINEITLPLSLGGKRIIVSVFPAGSGIGMIITDISELENKQ
jgi:PAS domain S-box-containing protein